MFPTTTSKIFLNCFNAAASFALGRGPVAPMGALGPRVKVSLLGGSSGSEALFVIVSNDPGRIICGGTGAMSGALFTSLTIMLKLLMSLKAGTALSVTCTVIRFVLGP